MLKIAFFLSVSVFVSCSLCFGQGDDPQLWCEYPAASGMEKDKHIVLLSGDEEYRSEEAMPMLGKLLSQRHGFKCTVIFSITEKNGDFTIDPTNQNNMPGIEALESADLVIMSLRFRNLPDEQMKYFDDYVMSGKPIIGLRTSTHAFNIPKDSDSAYRHYSFNSKENWIGGFGQQVLGDTWINHHGRHKVQATGGVINADMAEHPILNGVKDIFGPSDVYGISNLPDSAEVLVHGAVLEGMNQDDAPVEGKKNDPMMPIAWLKSLEHENGNTTNVMCTTMGASNDLANEGLRRLVVNSSYHLLGLSEQIQDDFNVEPVGEYNPTMYGFKIWKKGMRPSDYNLPEANE
jgi:hypothetical protein